MFARRQPFLFRAKLSTDRVPWPKKLSIEGSSKAGTGKETSSFGRVETVDPGKTPALPMDIQLPSTL